MDDCHLLAVVLQGKVEGISSNALRLELGGYFERLYDSRDGRVFLARVFAFCVLTDDGEIDLLVASRPVARQILDQTSGSIDIQILA